MKVVFWMLLGLLVASSLWIWIDSDVAKPKKNITEEEYIEETLKRLGYPDAVSAGGGFAVDGAIYVPTKGFFARQTENPFGVFRSGRFNGYHSGVDVEILPSDMDKDVPVYSIYTGTVAFVGNASGYGGVATIWHRLGDSQVLGVYGHLRLRDIKVSRGQKVKSGEIIGYLGANNSSETDGERKHLHFGLNKTESKSILGYVNSREDLAEDWLDPAKFLRGVGAKEVPTQ